LKILKKTAAPKAYTVTLKVIKPAHISRSNEKPYNRGTYKFSKR
jgi:hypothetical protein